MCRMEMQGLGYLLLGNNRESCYIRPKDLVTAKVYQVTWAKYKLVPIQPHWMEGMVGKAPAEIKLVMVGVTPLIRHTEKQCVAILNRYPMFCLASILNSIQINLPHLATSLNLIYIKLAIISSIRTLLDWAKDSFSPTSCSHIIQPNTSGNPLAIHKCKEQSGSNNLFRKIVRNINPIGLGSWCSKEKLFLENTPCYYLLISSLFFI